MGEIARFYGIVVRMYSGDWWAASSAAPPRHAEGQEVAVSLDSVQVIEGGLSRRNERLLVAWVELHLEALQWNWRALHEGERPRKIDPLR